MSLRVLRLASIYVFSKYVQYMCSIPQSAPFDFSAYVPNCQATKFKYLSLHLENLHARLK